jgi:hypothetical protein
VLDRVSTSSARLRALAAILALSVAAPAMAWGQATGSAVARAMVVPAQAPRVDVSLASAPAVRRVARSSPAGAGVEVRTAVRVAGTVGYRLLVRARAGAAAMGLSVRDASGVFHPLSNGAAVEVARGAGDEATRDVVYRLNDAPAGGELPFVYELVYEPVT